VVGVSAMTYDELLKVDMVLGYAKQGSNSRAGKGSCHLSLFIVMKIVSRNIIKGSVRVYLAVQC